MTYFCELCKRMYRRAEVPMSCCVRHLPGDCCHYGEVEVPFD